MMVNFCVAKETISITEKKVKNYKFGKIAASLIYKELSKILKRHMLPTEKWAKMESSQKKVNLWPV